jgi:hypothetical protein
MVAANWLALIEVGVTDDVPHCMTEPLTNPDPFTVSEKAGPPAVAEAGLKLVITGAAVPPLTTAVIFSLVSKGEAPSLAEICT